MAKQKFFKVIKNTSPEIFVQGKKMSNELTNDKQEFIDEAILGMINGNLMNFGHLATHEESKPQITDKLKPKLMPSVRERNEKGGEISVMDGWGDSKPVG
mmetsp:Transcript_41174/g.62626  ORF Transcript_41174/g.62626 Transcript_41174/m.62626 type:complete len:100 (+) Transcript_41174:659-958(+)|eukprot:CAMPEP_0170482400 /NCGR_PEP_ID=MMETSP0208-20121228/2434_1 /TAXON_ID=197538 /ORGANISM="Strombidium inclinatum, Strain S3" /LENGTH=99 /DNA_ID=CAMNT_0010755235 /DNA_START=5631 /DNA_END=5930 /DNA_ORIENTATION=-